MTLVVGGQGDDKIQGNGGGDRRLIGGIGDDRINGGSGSDLCDADPADMSVATSAARLISSFLGCNPSKLESKATCIPDVRRG